MNSATDTRFSYTSNFTRPAVAKLRLRSAAEKIVSSVNLLAIRRARMRLIFLTLCCVVVSAAQVRAASLGASESRFYYKEASGKTGSARIIRRYWPVPIVHPLAKVDPRIDPKLR